MVQPLLSKLNIFAPAEDSIHKFQAKKSITGLESLSQDRQEKLKGLGTKGRLLKFI